MKKVAVSLLGIISLFGNVCYIHANDLNPSGHYMRVISETKEFNSSICESCKTINIFIKNAYMFLMDILNNRDTINHTKHSEYIPKIMYPNISYELLIRSQARNEGGLTEVANDKIDNKEYTSNHQTEKSPLGQKETFEPLQVFELIHDEEKQAVPEKQGLLTKNDKLIEVNGSETWSNNQTGVEYEEFESTNDEEKQEVPEKQGLLTKNDKLNEVNGSETWSNNQTGVEHEEFESTNDEEKQAVPEKQGLLTKNDKLIEVNGSETWSNNQTGVEHEEFESTNDEEKQAVPEKQGLLTKNDKLNEVNGSETWSNIQTGVEHEEFESTNDEEKQAVPEKQGLLTKNDKLIEVNGSETWSNNQTGVEYEEFESTNDEEKQEVPEKQGLLTKNDKLNEVDGFETWSNNQTGVEYKEFESTNDEEKQAVRQKQAQMMQAYMTSEVDPCDDFYQFACGNWAKLNPMPKNNNLYSIFEILSTSTANYIKDLLEQPTSHNEPLAFTKAKNYYKSCLNYETIQSRGSKPLLSHLSSLGTWPMINNSSNYDWIWLAAQLSKYHTDILITYFVSQDKVIPSRYVINLDQTSLGLIDREDFLNRSNTKYFAYKEYMLKVAKLLGGDENVTEAVEDILTFETHLANISYPGNANPDPSDVKKFTIAKINEYIPDIDLKRYISLTFNFSGNSTEHVVVHSVKYFEKLGELLGKTEAKTIANYLLWKHINIWMTVLDFQYVNALYGTIEFPERSKFCIRQTTNNMGLAIGAMFVQKYFDKSNKNDTIVMARNIRSGFREVLFNNCWINNKTKHLAEEKINAILFSIGYSDDVLIEQKLDDYFKDVNIDPVLFFENNKNIFMATALRAKIGLPQNNLDWYISPSESGSYYDMRKNNIKISAAILQPPFYHKYFPKSLNYGGIGVQMGHLMSHSFDQLGIKYDQMAKLNEDWQKAFEQFSQKAACLIEQYDNLISGESNIQSEDLLFFHNDYIAEDGGIKQAFVAYKKWLNIHGDYDETLPEMNYTSGQLFFLNYAQVSCSSDRLQPLRKARVIGTLRNNEEFSKEFNCPPGSPMNPKKKCFFW